MRVAVEQPEERYSSRRGAMAGLTSGRLLARNTLINLALSKQSAAEIVDRIGVEKINGGEEPKIGMATKIVNFFKVGGTGTAPTATEAAIERVQGSLEAVVLDESWVMEITAWDPDPKLAREIADVTAEVAVDQVPVGLESERW